MQLRPDQLVSGQHVVVGRVYRLLMVIVLGVSTSSCDVEQPRSSYEDFGIILVESPEVYSRERLVNDRFLQHAWLEDLLMATTDTDRVKNMPFNSNATTGTVASNEGNIIIELAAKELGSTAGDEGGIPKQMQKADITGAVGDNSQVRPQTMENWFDDTLAFREAIRTEVMETLLDDRHDLKGNTLYRLKFDITLVPRSSGNDDDPLALVKIRLKDPYQNKRCPWEKPGAAWCAGAANTGESAGQERKCTVSEECELLQADLRELYNRWVLDTESDLRRELNFRVENYLKGEPGDAEASKMYRFYADRANASADPDGFAEDVEYIGAMRAKLSILERGFLGKRKSSNKPDESGSGENSDASPREDPCKNDGGDVRLANDCIGLYFGQGVPFRLFSDESESQNQVRTAMLLYAYITQGQHKCDSPDIDDMPFQESWCRYMDGRTSVLDNRKAQWKRWGDHINKALDAMEELEARRGFTIRARHICKVRNNPESSENCQLKNYATADAEWNLEQTLHSIREWAGDAAAFEAQLINNTIADYMLYTFALQKKLGLWADFELSGCGIGNCVLVVAPYGSIRGDGRALRITDDDICREGIKGTEVQCRPDGGAPLPEPQQGQGGAESCKGCKRWFSQLNSNVELFSYAISPKSRVQRIDDTMNRNNTRSLSAQVGVPVALKTAAKGAIDWRGSEQQFVNQIKRHPTVVGFGSQHIRKKTSETSFGWLLGPRFADREASQFHFRHVPVQQSVSAVVSVPSWWQQADVEISTCWLAPGNSALWKNVVAKDPDKAPDKAPALCDPHKHSASVRLPSSTADIPRKLRYAIGRSPFIKRPAGDTIADVIIGEPANIIIEGGDLWRSTVVTLGGQTASRVVVLPNMEGVIAEFKSIDQPRSWYLREPTGPKSCRRPRLAYLVVWTSEGSTPPLPVGMWSPDELEGSNCVVANVKPPEKPGEESSRYNKMLMDFH